MLYLFLSSNTKAAWRLLSEQHNLVKVTLVFN